MYQHHVTRLQPIAVLDQILRSQALKEHRRSLGEANVVRQRNGLRGRDTDSGCIGERAVGKTNAVADGVRDPQFKAAMDYVTSAELVVPT